uniref:Uncharacterized protein n=1 Tax=Arundo donax TaxID=35708 RepID=A0A0A9FNI9_ARUDO
MRQRRRRPDLAGVWCGPRSSREDVQEREVQAGSHGRAPRPAGDPADVA